jgi:hypothetical protein
MSTHCCEVESSGSTSETFAAHTANVHPPSLAFARRWLAIAKWLVPGAILALLPKCPACLAAYIALGTGVSLSLSTTAYVKALIVSLCLTVLASVAVRRLPRLSSLLFTTEETGQ